MFGDSPPKMRNIVIDNKYRIEKEYLDDEISSVFYAYDLVNFQLVNIVLLKKISKVYEVNIIKAVEHFYNKPHKSFPKVLHISSYNNQPYWVTETISEQTLGNFLKNKNKLTQIEALQICKELVEILGFAKNAGIVHGNLNEENIFLDKNNSVNVTQFGYPFIANVKHEDGLFETHGKLHKYIAPETVMTKRVSSLSDQYSLGILLLSMIISEPIFPSSDAADLRQRILNSDFTIPDQVTEIDDVTFSIVAQLTHRNPKLRIQSFSTLLARIEKAINHLTNSKAK